MSKVCPDDCLSGVPSSGANKDSQSQNTTRTASNKFLSNWRCSEANRTRKFIRKFGHIFVKQVLCGIFSVPAIGGTQICQKSVQNFLKNLSRNSRFFVCIFSSFGQSFDKFGSPLIGHPKTIFETNFGQIWGSGHFECCKGPEGSQCFGCFKELLVCLFLCHSWFL